MNADNKIGIIIQARMGSTRLPNKVNKLIYNDETVLGYLIDRLKLKFYAYKIIIATTSLEEDNVICNIAANKAIISTKGKINNVLSRFYNAAKSHNLKHIIRINSDCPLVCTYLIRDVVDFYFLGKFDYVATILSDTFPIGQHVEVFSFNALSKAYVNAKLDVDKEHVTPYIYNNPNIFKIGSFKNINNMSNIRMTLDYEEDLIFFRKLASYIGENKDIYSYKDIVRIIENDKELIKINQHLYKVQSIIH